MRADNRFSGGYPPQKIFALFLQNFKYIFLLFIMSSEVIFIKAFSAFISKTAPDLPCVLCLRLDVN